MRVNVTTWFLWSWHLLNSFCQFHFSSFPLLAAFGLHCNFGSSPLLSLCCTTLSPSPPLPHSSATATHIPFDPGIPKGATPTFGRASQSGGLASCLKYCQPATLGVVPQSTIAALSGLTTLSCVDLLAAHHSWYNQCPTGSS